MFGRILLGFDGSVHSLRAAALAGELARSLGSEIVRIVVAFDPIPSYLGEPFFSQVASARTQEAEDLADGARAAIGEIPGSFHVEVVSGQPAEAILKVAETRSSEVIIIGSRGSSVLGGMLLGSQTQKILHLAKCPVLVVR